ncbi:MAG TPA: oligosaccharide flippase family protein [Terriglobia bacterium]|nr:oligosaccharide flippase family protein [Terriglobia bacterium]
MSSSSLQAWVTRGLASRLPAGSLRQRFVVGTFWAFTGTLISQGLQLAALIVAARWLGRAEYGELGIVRSTVGMFGIFVGLGLGLTATRYVSELRRDSPKRAGRIAALTLRVAWISGVTVFAALILVSPWLAVHTLAAPAIAVPLALGAGLVLLGEVKGVQTGILAGLEAFDTIARVNLGAGLCAFPLILGGTWLRGLDGTVGGLVASLGVSYVLNHVALRREMAKAGVPFSSAGSWKERRVLWQFSVPAFLSSAVVTPATWICSAMLVNRANGYAEMGIFSAADQWRNALLFLPGIVARVLLPILSNCSKESAEEPSRFSNTLEAGFSAGVAVAFPLVTLFSFGGPLIAGAYGKEFAGMTRPLAGVLYAAGVVAIGTPVGTAVQAKGAMWQAVVNNLSWAVLLLASFHFLVARGAWGLAASYAFSYFCLTLIFLWYWCKAGYYPWRLGIRTMVACVALVAFAFGPVYLPSNLRLQLSPVALALSLVAVWLLVPRRIVAALLRKPDLLLKGDAD